MRGLILQSQLGTLLGGGESFTRNLFQAFSARGHEVEAAFFADPSGTYPIPLPPGIKPVPIRGRWSRKAGQGLLSAVGKRLPASLTGYWYAMQERVCWRTMRWYRRRFQKLVEATFARKWGYFDFVYVHGHPALAASVSAYCPTLLRLPGPVPPSEEPFLRRAHAVCANGDALIQIRRFLVNVIELPTGLDRQTFKPGESRIRETLGWGSSDFVMGYVGRLTHLKGVDLLARAFQMISDKLPFSRLLMIGDGEEEKNLQSLLKREMQSGRVHLVGGLPQAVLPDWYRSMNLLIMPSRYENFSNAVLEGLACGVPFLASNVGGNRIYADSGSGWLFESESTESLANQMVEIANSPVECANRGKVGIAFTENYSWEKRAIDLETIIKKHLLNGHD